MRHIFEINWARRQTEKLTSPDIKAAVEGLNFFCQHQVQAISRLPVIAPFLSHEDKGARELATIIFRGLSWQDPSLIREYVPTIVARFNDENEKYIKRHLLETLEPVAKEDDVHLLKVSLQSLSKELTTWNKTAAARVLRAVKRRSPELIIELPEESQQLLKKYHIGASRTAINKKSSAPDKNTFG